MGRFLNILERLTLALEMLTVKRVEAGIEFDFTDEKQKEKHNEILRLKCNYINSIVERQNKA